MGRSYFTFPAFSYVPLTTQSLTIILLPWTSQSDPRATIVQVVFKWHVLTTTPQLRLPRLRLVLIPTPMYCTVLTPRVARLYSLQVHTPYRI
jgi:hypothetical protein